MDSADVPLEIGQKLNAHASREMNKALYASGA
jgi:hypothetical protein